MKADEMLPACVADMSHLLRRIGKQAAYTMKFAYKAIRAKKIKVSQLSNRIAITASNTAWNLRNSNFG
jgi:hypothetical protein